MDPNQPPILPADYAWSVLESTVEGIWTIGLDGLIRTANASAVKMLGFDNADQLIGKNSHELIHHKRGDGTPYPQRECPIYKAFQLGQPCHLDNEVLWRPDGSFFHVDYRSVPLRRGSEIVGAVVTFLDNTEKLKAKFEFELHLSQGNDRLQKLLNNIPVFVGVLNAQGELIILNDISLDVIESTREREVGRPFWETGWWNNVPGIKEKMTSALARSLAGTGSRFDTPYRTKIGGVVYERWVDFSMQPIVSAGGEITEMTVTGFDITERIEQSKELERSKVEAETANRTKSVFLANMSHEIRSPLGAIIGFCEVLRTAELSKAEIANFLSVIDRNSQHLLRIVDDILDLAKVEAGKMLIEHIDFSFSDLLADFSSLMGFRARDKGIGFTIRVNSAIPNFINSDPTRLGQILNNVVGNAIKFTDRGQVEMAITYANELLHFRISDTGPGISAEQVGCLFQAFQQADPSTTRKFGGTGLGLILTRRLTKALGGDFELERTALGRGSVFVASIKVRLPSHYTMLDGKELEFVANPVSSTPLTPVLVGIKVLVVEDSPDNQVLFSHLLEKAGAQVELAENGIEAVQLALKNAYDVILMDVQMPQMDGHEATQRLRSAGYQGTIIALTAHAMKEERERARRSGFTDFLSKPVQRDALTEIITKYCR